MTPKNPGSFVCFFLLLAASTVAAEQPNFVVIFSDDAGYADFGFQPDVRKEMRNLTPNIDTIARDGVRFTNAYMSGCVCSPSRAGLMTGRYQQRFGHENNVPPGEQNGLSLAETFGAKRLQDAGYKTGLVGKWHLGYPEEFQPNQRGFDWFYGLLQGSRSYYPYKDPSRDRVIQETGKPTPEAGYVTDRFGDAACRFIEKHKEKPFFLFVSFTAPHGPREPRRSDRGRIAHIASVKRHDYAGLIVALDDNVGKILSALKKAGVEDKTLVVYTNDNGGSLKVGANNYPLRGGKGGLYEGGVRVPWAMRWPGKIQPGSVIDDPVIALDLIPTFLTAGGGKVDPAWKLDGISLTDRITGREQALPQRTFYWRQHGSRGSIAVRDGDWKLVYPRKEENAQPQLYDLREDIRETKDLAEENPDVVKSRLEKLAKWESQPEEPRWGPGHRK